MRELLPDELLEAMDVKNAVIKTFLHLTIREQQVLYEFFFTEHAMTVTGKNLEYQVTPSRVAQIRQKALRRIRGQLWRQKDKREDILSSYKEHYNL